jgi:Bacteriocin-protection, YdeI or OmpD-Associated/Domain of unknown function (DUF1905)
MTRANRAPRKTVTVTIHREGAMCFVPVTFDPKSVFGKIRAPVKVTVNGHTYRSTIASMGGITCIPLRKSNREAAALTGGETLAVTMELDTAPREIAIPTELKQALGSGPAERKQWDSLSYTQRREMVEAIEGAKKPETRARRVALITLALASAKRPLDPKQRPRRP